QREDRLHRVLMKEALIGAERCGSEAKSLSRLVEQRQTTLLFRRYALEDLHAQPEQDAMPVLHEGVHRVAGIGASPRTAFRHGATVRIAQRAVRGIAPSLAAKVDGAVARVGRLVGLAVLGPQPSLVLLRIQRDFQRREALVAGVRADERAVGADMAAHEPRRHRAPHGVIEESLEQPGLIKTAT